MSLNEGILGHKKQAEIIKKALDSNTLPHAYLFAGIGGIGKRRMALKLAAALQCNVLESRPCGTCAGCRKIKEGNPALVFEIHSYVLVKFYIYKYLQTL